MRATFVLCVLLAACNGIKPGGGDDTDTSDQDDTDATGGGGDTDSTTTDTDKVKDTFDTGGDTDVATGGDTDTLLPVDTDLTHDSGDTDTGTGSTGTWQHTGGWTHTGDTFTWDTNWWDTGTTTPACTITDPYEPNDSPGTATATGVDADADTYSVTGTPLDGALGDDDYFQAEIPVGCRLDATVTFDHLQGDVGLAVGDGYTMYDYSNSYQADSESVSWGNTGDAPMPVWVRVYQGSDACVTYDLSMTIVCPTPCADVDSAEENNDTATATPSHLADTDGGSFTRTDVGLAGSLADHDVYRVGLQPGCGVVADVSYDPSQGDVGMRGFGVDVDLSVDDGSGTGEVALFNASDYERTTYVDVYTPDDTCLVYDIDLEVTCGGVGPGVDPTACTTDPYEPNNDITAAYDTVVNGSTGTWSATDIGSDGRDPASDDWYYAVVPANCALYAEARFVDMYGDIDIELDDVNGYVDGSYSTNNSEAIRWISTSSAPTEVWLQVSNLSTVSCTTYDLSLDVYCPDPTTLRICGADPYESNDTIPTATETSLAAGGDHFDAQDVEMAGSAGVTTDLDVYHVSIPQGCSAVADIDFIDAIDDLDLYIVDANQTALAVSASAGTDHEHAELANTGAAAEDVWVVVYPYDYECTLYDIAIDIVCAP